MAIRYKTIQSSFVNGELSPRLLARVDLKTYSDSAKTIENGVCFTHGGITKRDGTLFIGEVRNSAKKVRLVPFVYSRTEAYAMVFNNGKIEFAVNEGFLIVSGITRASVAHPYTDAELADINYAQYGNTMIICHGNHPPKLLQRLTTTTWSFTDIAFTDYAVADAWYENAFVSFQIYTTGSGFVVGDKFTFVTDGAGNNTPPVFVGTAGAGGMAGITVDADLDEASTWTAICDFAVGTRFEFNITKNTGITSPVGQWSANNYPKSVSFYEQRLYFGGSDLYPQTLWASASGAGDFFNITAGPLSDDGLRFTIASNSYDEILQLESTRNLLPMTYGSEYSLAGSQGAGVSASSVVVRSHTNHGIATVKPLRLGEELLFVQRDGLKVRAISYDVSLDTNIAPDITILAEHISEGGITDMSYAQSPDGIVWAVRADGVLLACTHLRDQAVTAWTRNITDGLFEAVTTVPANDSDNTYLAVKRTINGSTVRNIELFKAGLYMDSALEGTSGGAGSTVWTGLDHLEGETIDILADGSVVGSKTVVSGSVTLDEAANEVQFGMPFNVKIELLHPEVATAEGTSQGASMSIYEAVLRVQDTIGLKINGVDTPINKFAITLGAPPTAESGDTRVPIIGWKSPNNLLIEHDIPQPFTLLGAILKVNIGN